MAGLSFNPNVTEKPFYQVNSQWGSNVRGIGGFEGGYTGGTGIVEAASSHSSRAVDNLPKAQMVAYQENLPPQDGRDAGISTWSLMA